MKVLILAGGYGTRLARDLEKHADAYPHLVGVAKPLLPVAGQPLISHWVDMLRRCPQKYNIKEIYIVVNEAFRGQFETWCNGYPEVELVCDGTHCNEERLGAVGCIELAVRHFGVHDDLMVIGGDTLFMKDFNLTDFLESFHSSPCREGGGAMAPCREGGGAMAPCYKCKDEDTVKLGIVEVDDSGCVTSFLEKPPSHSTASRLACPCFYLFSSGCLELVSQFLEEKKDAPISERDATGLFIKYLSSKRPVYVKEISGRFDVGNLQSYLDCVRRFKP